MNRQFLAQFLNKISDFPSWVKEIIYVKLSEEINKDSNLAYTFATYKPILTYKGKCELDFKKSSFDTNIYNILSAADNDNSISDITINTYLSMEEVAGYFLFGVDEGYFEIPDNSQILSIAGFLAGKLRTGEYFMNSGTISETELNSAVETYEKNKDNKKFGQSLIELGLITQRQLDTILLIKEEAKKRFVLDHNEVPEINQEYAKDSDNYQKQIEDLKEENSKLKTKLDQLLTMVKRHE
ncbi:hypothetical protein J6A64_02645 [bacterium]|nr:hypothetical protein [bacterium]MBO5447026.1 hypothetical protein [bacterium]